MQALVDPEKQMKQYTPATVLNMPYSGKFSRSVNFFAFFEDAHLSAKLKYRPSSTSRSTTRELTTINCVVHACKQQRDGCKTS